MVRGLNPAASKLAPAVAAVVAVAAVEAAAAAVAAGFNHPGGYMDCNRMMVLTGAAVLLDGRLL